MSDNVTVIQELYSAFGRGDLDAILDRIDDEPDWCCEIEAPGGDVVPLMRNVRTKADVAATYFGNVVATMDMHRFLPHTFLASGDDVVVLLSLDYTVRPTGKRLAVEEVHHFTLRDGRIVRYRPYLDTAAMVAAFTPA